MRRGNGGPRLGREGMVGRMSPESDSNGSEFRVASGCTRRRGEGSGRGLAELMIW